MIFLFNLTDWKASFSHPFLFQRIRDLEDKTDIQKRQIKDLEEKVHVKFNMYFNLYFLDQTIILFSLTVFSFFSAIVYLV